LSESPHVLVLNCFPIVSVVIGQQMLSSHKCAVIGGTHAYAFCDVY